MAPAVLAVLIVVGCKKFPFTSELGAFFGQRVVVQGVRHSKYSLFAKTSLIEHEKRAGSCSTARRTRAWIFGIDTTSW